MFDKSKWIKVKLGDVAQEIKLSGKFPYGDGFNRIVGLEHLDPSCLKINRWIDITDDTETTFTKLFTKGQVLFGRRRAYQKKAAFAEFNGVCSGDITVIESNGKIDPALLPFIVQNDRLFDFAMAMSNGSLSPRVKWADLSKYEFVLPPIEDQNRLAELLWSADEVIYTYNKAYLSASVLYESFIRERYFDSKYSEVSIGSLVVINKKSISARTVDPDYKFKYIDIGAVIAPKVIDYENLNVLTFSDAPSRARRCVSHGDIVMSSVRPNLQSFAIVKGGEYIASTGFITMTPIENYLRPLIFHVLFSQRFLQYCKDNVTGTNYPAISAGKVSLFCINLPPAEEAKALAKQLNELQQTLDNLKSQELQSKVVLSQLLRQLQ